MILEQKIAEWRELKKSQKALDTRVKELRSYIITYLPANSNYGVEIQERNKTTYDESNVWSLMHQKGIPEEMFTRPVIDEGKLEQLYYDGALTDDDLRYIRKPQLVYALIEKEPEDVQG